jgi:hypothetical protein
MAPFDMEIKFPLTRRVKVNRKGVEKILDVNEIDDALWGDIITFV